MTIKTASGQTLPEPKDLKRKVLLGILTNPVTLLPAIAGFSTFLSTLMFDAYIKVGGFAFLLGALGTGGIFLVKLISTGDERAKQAVQEMQAEAHRVRELSLDDLARRLEGDRDRRTERALGDLRELAHALDQIDDDGLIDSRNPTVIDIKLSATQLFEQCVRSLEHSLRLWQTAQRMRTLSARRPILEQRERIVEDVYRSVRDLGNVLVALQSLGVYEDSSSELARIRNELNQNLQVAQRVDERLREFENDVERQLRD